MRFAQDKQKTYKRTKHDWEIKSVPVEKELDSKWILYLK